MSDHATAQVPDRTQSRPAGLIDPRDVLRVETTVGTHCDRVEWLDVDEGSVTAPLSSGNERSSGPTDDVPLGQTSDLP